MFLVTLRTYLSIHLYLCLCFSCTQPSLWCVAFSSCGALAPEPVGSLVVVRGRSCSMACGTEPASPALELENNGKDDTKFPYTLHPVSPLVTPQISVIPLL